MGRALYSLATIMVLATSFGAVAETTTPDNGRFTMSPVDGGFLRLDKETGAVSMCAKSGADWACKPVDDQAAPTRGDVAKLEDENRVLKDRIKALEGGAGNGGLPPPPGVSPGGKVELPTDEQVDQALDYLERMYKKLRDRVKDLDKPGMPPPPPSDSNTAPKKSL